MKNRAGIPALMSRNKFAIITLATAFLIGLTIFGLAGWINTKIEREKTVEFLGEGFNIIKGSSHRLEGTFVGIGHELEQLSRLEEVQNAGKNQDSEIVRVTYQSMSKYISCLKRLDREGNLVLGYRDDCVPIEKAPGEGDWDYFQTARRDKIPVVSDIFINGEGQKRIRIAYPIIRDGGGEPEEFDGVVTAGVKVDAIFNLISPSLSETEKEWMHVIWYDSKGRLIQFPDHPAVDRADLRDGESTCRSCHESLPEFTRPGNGGHGWEITRGPGGRKMIVLYNPVKLANQKFVVGLFADYDRAVAEASEISHYINFIAALSCMIVLFGWILLLSLVRVRRTADIRRHVIARERELLNKVKESEERYRTLFDGVRSGVYVSTPDGRFLEVNDAMVKMLEYDSREELLAIDIESDLYVDSSDRARFKEEIEKHLVLEDLETRLRKKDGTQIICLETSYGRRDKTGRIVEYLGMLVDITARKRMEVELEDSRRRLRELFDGASLAIFVEDLKGNILDVNRRAIELFGYGRDEFLDMNAIDLLPPEDARNFDRFIEALEEDGDFNLETRNRVKGGDLIDVEVDAQKVTVEEETLVQVFVRDLSEIRQKESEIRDKNDQLNTLHEISKIISQSLVLEDILDLTIRKVIEVTPFDAGVVYLCDESTRTLHFKASFGFPADAVRVLESTGSGDALAARAVRDREIVTLGSISDEPESTANRTGHGLRASIGIPIIYGQKIMGVMSLISFTSLGEDDYPVGLLRGIAELMGMAISNATMYKDSQKRAIEMQILYEAGKAFMAITDFGRLSAKVIEIAKDELGYEACALLLLDEEKKELSVLDTSYDRKGGMKRDRLRVGVDGIVGWVAEKRKICYVRDISTDERYLPGWLDRGSELAIPLMVGEEVLGVIDFEQDDTNGFSPEGIRYLSLFANQVAWAFYNVKLFEEIKKANEDLNRLSEMKSQFVSLVSHELRTPMTAIKGSLDIIHSGASGPVQEKQKMFISMARRNIDRLNDMVNNILDLSRIEAGKIEFEFRETNFQEPLNHVLLTLSATAEENNVVLESQLPSDLPSVYADEAKIEQILTNLIGNALKHTPSGGKVTVVAGMAGDRDVERFKDMGGSVPPASGYVRISVIDTGSGIPKDQLEAIFDRYKQLHGKKGERGTGLGLAICRYLVEEQNGVIWAERGAEVGSVLSFLLPIYAGEKAAHINKRGTMVSGKNEPLPRSPES